MLELEKNPAPTNVAQRLIEQGSLLRRYVGRHTAEPQDAADIYQESILRVMEQARGRAIHNPLAYAIRVAKNLIINKPKARNESDDALQELICPAPSPEESLNQQQRLQAFKTFLATMPSLRREVLLRRRINGETRAQIAAAMDMSEDAVKKHITRALADLQRFVDEQNLA